MLAVVIPLHMANTEGPDPEIPQLRAPELILADLISSNFGIKTDLKGSITTSLTDLLIKS